MLSPLGFKFQIKKLPDVNFFLQKVSMPQISVDPVSQPSPFVKIPHPGDHMEYNTLDIVFKVDEDLNNYRQLHDWIRGTGFPETIAEYRALASRNEFVGAGILSDATLIITTNLKNPNLEITFEDAFPFQLGSLDFDSTNRSVDFITCSARFAYKLFQVTVLP